MTSRLSELPPIESLDPGIRDTVAAIRRAGMTTTDSGDGVSKPPEERAMDVRHVAVSCPDAAQLIPMAEQLEAMFPDAHVDPHLLRPCPGRWAGMVLVWWDPDSDAILDAYNRDKHCPACGGKVVADNEEAKGRELHVVCLGCGVEAVDPEWRDIGDEWEVQP